MGKGARPKPSAIKIADGSAAKNPQRMNKAEPAAMSGDPVMPDGLDEHGQKAWKHLADNLRHWGMFSATYQYTLDFFAETYSNYVRARDQVEEEGFTVLAGNGGTKPNPAADQFHKSRDACMRILIELGMTPSAKTKIVAPEKEKGDEERFFGKVS